jgi:hypothetical protein
VAPPGWQVRGDPRLAGDLSVGIRVVVLAKFLMADRPVRMGRPAVVTVLALVCVYAAVVSGHVESIDGRLMFQQGMSLGYDHSLHFRQPVPTLAGPYWTSKYGIGLSLIYVPTLLLASWLFPGLVAAAQADPAAHLWPLYAVAGAPVQIAIVVLTALLIGYTVRRLGGGIPLALLGMAAFGLAFPGLVYARMDVAQPLLGLCIIGGIWAAVSYQGSHDSRWLVLGAGAQCLAILTRPIEAALLLPMLLVLARSLRGVLPIGLGLLVGVVGTLAVDWGRYGSPFITGYGAEGFSTPILTGVSGSLFSPGRGILWSFPAVILVPIGVARLWRQGQRGAALALPGFCLALLVLVGTWDIWWGGYNWGLRLYVPALPVIAVLAAIGAASLRHWLGAALVIVLLVAGVIWAAPGVVTDLGAGYGAMADKTAGSWNVAAYPPLGAWAFMHHWLGSGIGDTSSANILWLRLTRATGRRLLLIPAALIICSAGLSWVALREAQVSVWGSGDPAAPKGGRMSKIFGVQRPQHPGPAAHLLQLQGQVDLQPRHDPRRRDDQSSRSG